MSKDSSNDKIKCFSKGQPNLPQFINNDINRSKVIFSEDTKFIRVPFGIRLSKKRRPEKNQNIATLILPITSINTPNPPPNVA